jgi:hypothetical protein
MLSQAVRQNSHPPPTTVWRVAALARPRERAASPPYHRVNNRSKILCVIAPRSLVAWRNVRLLGSLPTRRVRLQAKDLANPRQQAFLSDGLVCFGPCSDWKIALRYGKAPA